MLFFRVIWFIAVGCAFTLFLSLAITRLTYFFTYPKSVNVEVTYEESLPFPAVTLCNQNIFRYDTICCIFCIVCLLIK